MRRNATLFEQLLAPGYQIDVERFWGTAHQLRPPMERPGARTYGDLLAAMYDRDGNPKATRQQVAMSWGWSSLQVHRMAEGAIASLRNPVNYARYAYRESPSELKPLDWDGEPDTWENRFKRGIASLTQHGLSTRARNNLVRHYKQREIVFREGQTATGRLLEFDEWIEQVQAGDIDLLEAGWYSFGEKTNREFLETLERRNAAKNQT